MPIKKIRLSVNERCKGRELQSSPGASEARKEAASCDPGEVPGISTGGPQGPCRQKAAHLPTDSMPFQFHSPHSTCTSKCDKPWAGAHWGSSQSLELAQPSSQHPTVICTRSGTSWPISKDPLPRPIKVPEGPSDSLGMLEYLTRIVTLVSFAQVSKPVSVGQNSGGVYGE